VPAPVRVPSPPPPSLPPPPVQVVPRQNDHTMPVLIPQPLQDPESYLTLRQLQRAVGPHAMPAENFGAPPAARGVLGPLRGGSVFEKLASLWPFKQAASREFPVAGASNEEEEAAEEAAELEMEIEEAQRQLDAEEQGYFGTQQESSVRGEGPTGREQEPGTGEGAGEGAGEDM